MTEFRIHTAESAPAASQPALRQAINSLGFLPSLYGGLAESPTALQVYLQGAEAFSKSTLSPVEQQVVFLAVSVANACEFCVAAHSVIARHFVKVPSPVVDSLRRAGPLPDARLQALAQFTRRVVADRGWVPDTAVDQFLAAGFTRAQALEVIVGVSVKTLSNYANHLMKTPVDPQFAAEAWQRPAAA